MVGIFIVLLCLNVMALGCMSDIRKITTNTTIIDFCLATKVRRIIMLVPPVAFIIGMLALMFFVIFSVVQVVLNFIDGK